MDHPKLKFHTFSTERYFKRGSGKKKIHPMPIRYNTSISSPFCLCGVIHVSKKYISLAVHRDINTVFLTNISAVASETGAARREVPGACQDRQLCHILAGLVSHKNF